MFITFDMFTVEVVFLKALISNLEKGKPTGSTEMWD